MLVVPGERLRGLGGGDRFHEKQQRAGRLGLIGCTAQLHGKEQLHVERAKRPRLLGVALAAQEPPDAIALLGA